MHSDRFETFGSDDEHSKTRNSFSSTQDSVLSDPIKAVLPSLKSPVPETRSRHVWRWFFSFVGVLLGGVLFMAIWFFGNRTSYSGENSDNSDSYDVTVSTESSGTTETSGQKGER